MLVPPHRPELSLDDYVDGVLTRDVARFARAITLVESRNPGHQRLAQQMLSTLLPHTGGSRRVGITGVPGVGKSTFIEALGCQLIARGLSVAVLAVDPTSGRSGGSILGDKTRMQKLSVAPGAFIRPSPAGQALGGVTRTTRETLLLCEAAGFDVVLVETVGVGQSETAVAEMVDFFLVLMLPGAGDELQGIKKGVLELADMIAVNKADGDNLERARSAARDYRAALRIIHPRHMDWQPPVTTVSALEATGLDELWGEVERHRALFSASGRLEAIRRDQQLRWMWSMVEDRLKRGLRDHERVRAVLPEVTAGILDGTLTATVAAERVLNAFGLDPG